MELVKQIKSEKLNEEIAYERLSLFVRQYFKDRKIELDESDLKHLKIDLKVNAQGIYFAAMKEEKKS